MTSNRAFVIAMVLVARCAVASAQDAPAGAGKLEIGGFPGGGLWLGGGNDLTEVNFNNYAFGGDVTWYFTPKVAVEGEGTFGLGISQNVNYNNKIVYRTQMPHTLGTSADVVIFPGGSARHLAGYVAGGAGTLTLFSRTAASRVFGVTENETFLSSNAGGGVKIFRRGEARNWGFRFDYRVMMINSKSSAVAFFAQSKQRIGQRFYIGMLYTARR